MTHLQERVLALRDIRRAINGELDTEMSLVDLKKAESAVMRHIRRIIKNV